MYKRQTYGLASKLNIEMPITEAIYKVIEGKINALEAVDILMGRDGKVECCLLYTSRCV